MDDTSIEAKIEALLFLFGEPVEFKKLADTLKLKVDEIKSAVSSLSNMLSDGNRGLHLVVSGDTVQITTKPSLGALLTSIAEEELDSHLTSASLETLAIVAYLGPCRRSLVEHIRGVNSSFILRSLMIRGLVERKPDPKRPNTFLYQASMNFLRHMGVSRIEDLPEYEKYKEFNKLFTGEAELSDTNNPSSAGNESSVDSVNETAVGDGEE